MHVAQALSSLASALTPRRAGSLALGVAALATLALSAPDLAHADGNGRLKRGLDEILRDGALKDARVGVHVMDLASGDTLYSRRSDKRFNPASNIKLVTAAAALDLYGPSHTYTTEVFGEKQRGSKLEGDIVLVGGGDPFLLWSHLLELAERVRRKGITTVQGDLVVDDSCFDNAYLPPAFGQKSEDAAYRPSVSGAAAEFGALNIIIEGTKAGEKPRVRFDPPNDYAKVENRATTVASKGDAGGGLQVSAVADGDRTKIIVGGKTYPGGGATVRKRMDHPSLFTGYMFRRALKLLGVTVEGKVTVGAKPKKAKLLARHSSYLMSYMIASMQKWSNNFMAEMIFKSLDARGDDPATWEGAQKAAKAFLAKAGVEGDYKLTNGSGLYDANALTPAQFTQVLRYMQTRPGILAEFESSFAIAGRDGTLRKRMTSGPAAKVARAKTGTLRGVVTITGVVQLPSGRKLGYSILFNKTRGGAWGFRRIQDRMIDQISKWRP